MLSFLSGPFLNQVPLSNKHLRMAKEPDNKILKTKKMYKKQTHKFGFTLTDKFLLSCSLIKFSFILNKNNNILLLHVEAEILKMYRCITTG